MKEVTTYSAIIFLGLKRGTTDRRIHSLKDVETYLSSYCDRVGLCVTMTETRFIYTGGSEVGAMIGLINYPRFPSKASDITARAMELAELLQKEYGQTRLSVMFSDKTVMLERE